MQKWNSKVFFPSDNYILRVIGATFGPSKTSGNPMITLESEIVTNEAASESVNVAGEDYLVAGQQVNNYYPTIVFADADGNVDTEKTDNAQKRVVVLFERLGLPTDNINFENPDLTALKGKTFYASMYADKAERRKSATAEQLAKGQKVGDVMKNPIDGKPLINYYPKIDEIFGLAQTDSNKSY